MTEPTGPGVLEPTSETVPTTTVEIVGPDTANSPVAAPRQAHRLRWALAAVGVAAVLGLGAIGFAVVASGTSPSSVLPWAPSDAVVYGEVRADMPGAQRANLLAFLSKFPGFADQTNFDAKADDGLDRLVKHMTDNKHDFSTEIKPWFSGQLGVSVEATDPSAPGILDVASVRDSTKAAAWLASVTPTNWTHEVEGLDLAESPAIAGAPRYAVVLDGSVILAGTVASVKTAVANGPSNALANNASFKAAEVSLGGDTLGSAFVDLKAYYDLMTSSAPKLMAIPTIDTSMLPGWAAMRIQAESDHLVLDAAVPATALTGTSTTNSSSALAPLLPSDTVVQYDSRNVGATVKQLLAKLEAQPGGPSAAQVDAIAKYVGGVDAAVGWLGDADGVVLHDSAGFSGGLVAQTNDAAASADLLTALKSLVSLGGAKEGISLGSETYVGHTITLVKASGLTSLGDFEIAISQTDKVVIVGIGDGFVKSVLDTKPGDSLADQPAYQKVINLAGASNAGQAYVDLTGLRTGLEGLAAGSSKLAEYDANVKPYLEPLASLALADSISGGVLNERWVLVLK